MSSEFQAGRLKYFVFEWNNLTSDPQILDIVQNCHIEFIDGIPPSQNKANLQTKFNQKETEIIDNEIENLLQKFVIKEVQYEYDMFLSPIFVRPTKNGEFRMILNLKKINESVEYHHFKMDSFEKSLSLIKKGMFLASVDLRHAYYSVHIAEEHQNIYALDGKTKYFNIPAYLMV